MKFSYKSLLYAINGLVPKKANRFLFYSNPDYSDNSLALYQYIVERREEIEFIWLVDQLNAVEKNDKNTIILKRKSIKGLIALMTSKVVVFTHHLYSEICNQKNQIIINVWHGEPIKKIGYLADSNADIIPNHYTFMCVTSELYQNIMSKCMKSDLTRNIITGLPRNDYLFQDIHFDSILGKRYKKQSKVVIWMPTFRQAKNGYEDGDEGELGLPIINKSNITELNEYLKNLDMILIVKLHPISIATFGLHSLSNIVNYNDLNNLQPDSLYKIIGNCDALITDYSSVYIDFLILNKPIGFVTDDISSFTGKRGFIFDNIEDYMPGQFIKTKNDLFRFFFYLASNKDDYVEQRENANKILNFYRDNKNCERVWSEIERRLKYNN